MSRGSAVARRLGALERKRQGAAPTACSTCGAPRPGQPMWVCIHKDGRPRWGVCKECGLPIDQDGKPCSAIPLPKGEKRIGPVLIYTPDLWWMHDCI